MKTIFCFLRACMASAARADVISMRNGDRISGEIVAMAGGKLAVRTHYAGELIVEWSEVASLETERPLAVMFHRADAPELRRLDRDADLARIAYLNPKPHGNATSRRLYRDGRAHRARRHAHSARLQFASGALERALQPACAFHKLRVLASDGAR